MLNRDDIIRMAREAGLRITFDPDDPDDEDYEPMWFVGEDRGDTLTRFFNLAYEAGAAAEREAYAAKLQSLRAQAYRDGNKAGKQAEPVAWIDNTGHPKHRLYLQSATERRLYGPLRPLYAVPRPITTTTKPEPQPEPFGYFRAEPFGWTDCAETDEGAKALYQKPPTAWTPATTPPDTERTVLVWAGDEWLSAWYHSESGHWMDACMGAGLVNVTHWMEPTPPTTTTQPEPK